MNPPQQNNSVAQSSNSTAGTASRLGIDNGAQRMSMQNSFSEKSVSALSLQGGQLGRGQVQWNDFAQPSNPTEGHASQLVISNGSQSMSAQNSFSEMTVSTLSLEGGQIGRGQVQRNNGFAQSSVHAGSNILQHVHSNSTQSTAIQNILPAQRPAFVRTGVDPSETHRLMDVEYEDTCRRLGPFNDEEKSRLRGMFRVWGDALISNDTAAAYSARSTIRACKPGNIGSISTWHNDTPNLAANSSHSNQRVSQPSVDTGYLPVGAQLSGQASSGGPMQRPTPQNQMNNQSEPTWPHGGYRYQQR